MAYYLENKVVKIRKPQVCFGCAGTFEPKNTLKYVKWVDVDGFGSCYWCEVCEKICSEESYDEQDFETMPFGILKSEFPERFIADTQGDNLIPDLSDKPELFFPKDNQ